MVKYWKTQVPRIEVIIADPKRKEEIQIRPHIRFDADKLQAVDQPWGHGQNDAWSYLIAIILRVAIDTAERLSREAEEIVALQFQYFDAIDYATDPDSGAWEEDRKLNSSSIAAVIRALLALQEYTRKFDGATGPLHRVESIAAAMISRGRRVLDFNLPFESPPIRYADAALLFSLYPTEVIASPNTQNLILGQIEARLLGPIGIRRYNGDSYYCQDYDRWFNPNQLSNDHHLSNALRDQFLVPGYEAQWCIFDSVFSAIYGRRYAQSGSDAHLAQQLRFMNRAIAQLTPDLRCPEMYYFRNGEWVTNPHTPLVWAQANMKVALRQLSLTAATQRRARK
jgi:phosphorylase kinase alpha/beta subunit